MTTKDHYTYAEGQSDEDNAKTEAGIVDCVGSMNGVYLKGVSSTVSVIQDKRYCFGLSGCMRSTRIGDNKQ